MTLILEKLKLEIKEKAFTTVVQHFHMLLSSHGVSLLDGHEKLLHEKVEEAIGDILFWSDVNSLKDIWLCASVDPKTVSKIINNAIIEFEKSKFVETGSCFSSSSSSSSSCQPYRLFRFGEEKYPQVVSKYSKIDLYLRRLNALAYVLRTNTKNTIAVAVIKNIDSQQPQLIISSVWMDKKGELESDYRNKIIHLGRLVKKVQVLRASMEHFHIDILPLMPLIVHKMVKDELQYFTNFSQKNVERHLVKLIFSLAELYGTSFSSKNFPLYYRQAILENEPVVTHASLSSPRHAEIGIIRLPAAPGSYFMGCSLAACKNCYDEVKNTYEQDVSFRIAGRLEGMKACLSDTGLYPPSDSSASDISDDEGALLMESNGYCHLKF